MRLLTIPPPKRHDTALVETSTVSVENAHAEKSITTMARPIAIHAPCGGRPGSSAKRTTSATAPTVQRIATVRPRWV
jgi:hypothetical protein